MNELVTVEQPQASAPQIDENTKGIIRSAMRDQGPVVSEGTRIKLRLLRNRYDEFLLPGSTRWILGRVATALGHYFVAGNPEALSKEMARDWQKALSKRPAWAVDKAFTQWIEDEPSKRPTPGAIGKLAYTFSQKSYERRDLLIKILSNAPTQKAIPKDDQPRDKRGRTPADIAYGVEMFGISKWILKDFGQGVKRTLEELAEMDAEVAKRVKAAKDRLVRAGGPQY